MRGFTGNVGRAVGELLPHNTTMVGMYGKPEIDPIYKEYDGKCSLISIADPVICNILEFSDGKIMMTHAAPMLNFTWNDAENILQDDAVRRSFQEAQVICLGYWSNMPDFDSIVNGILQEKYIGKEKKQAVPGFRKPE